MDRLLSTQGISRMGGAWLGLFVAIALGYLGFSSLVRVGGYAIVSDLSVFWTAAQLALQGKATAAYQEPILHATLAAAVPTVKGNFGWFYPPAFYLLVLPLAHFAHYFPAYLAWELPTGALFLEVWRRWTTRPSSWWMLAGFGGLWLNLLHGQNAFLTAGLGGFALRALVAGSPWAGFFVGMLGIKPQLVLVPAFLLLLTRNAKALVVAMVTLLVTNGLALMVLGPGVLEAWWHSMTLARHYLEQDGMGSRYWLSMPTVFAQMRLWGFTVAGSYAAQGLSGVAAIGVLWVIWRRGEPRTQLMSGCMVSLMVSPYLMDYDLLWLGWFLVVMLEWGQDRGWRKGEAVLWLGLWLMPVVGCWWVGQFGFHWAPWLMWGALVGLWRVGEVHRA